VTAGITGMASANINKHRHKRMVRKGANAAEWEALGGQNSALLSAARVSMHFRRDK
jgi:hypothetical protein